MHPYFEDRERYERHIDPTFSSPSGKNRVDLYTRVRVGSLFDLSPRATAKVEYQYAHDAFWTQNLNGSGDASDLSLAYVRYDAKQAVLTGGRQKIDLGEQRLIGSAEWLNLARSFDAARVQSGQWDIWDGRLGVANNKPESARVGAITHVDRTWGTTSLITKHDLGATAGIDIQTLDHFMSLKAGSVRVDLEGAVQTGTNNGRDQRAWAWHAKATRTLLPKTTISVTADAASGGGDANTSRTFDNLYPSNHNAYGLSDMTGWKNMNHVGVALESKPCSNWTFRASGHAYSLRDASDGWYAATGGINARDGGKFIDPTGLSGRELGRELDLEAIYSPMKNATLSAGVAMFNTGSFVQNVGGVSNQMTFGYVQFVIRF